MEFISINETGSSTNDNGQAPNKVTVKRPIAKRAGRSFSESVPASVQSTSSQTQSNFKKPDSNTQPAVEQSANGKIPSGITMPLIPSSVYCKYKGLINDNPPFQLNLLLSRYKRD